jgi:hypothetical protein
MDPQHTAYPSDTTYPERTSCPRQPEKDRRARASARARLTVAVCAAAIAAAACSGATAPPGGGSGHTSQPATTPASPTAPATSAAPVTCPGGWKAGQTTISHQVTVPPLPVVTAIRTGTHPECRYDRLVLDISGPTPWYSVGFVRKVIQDGSGKTLTLPGTRYLVIRLNPAQGHTDSGKPTLPAGLQALSFPQLRGYEVAGDFEGVVTIALGLNDGTRYRVGELPGKLYIDVAW